MKFDKKVVPLCENVSEISMIANEVNFYLGDSRDIIILCIYWAYEFDKIHEGYKWGEDFDLPNGNKPPYGDDYIGAIQEFAYAKIKETLESARDLDDNVQGMNVPVHKDIWLDDYGITIDVPKEEIEKALENLSLLKN